MIAKRAGRKLLKCRQKARRGRPPVHREAWSKVSMVLFDRQIVGFDRIINDIRQRTGKVMSRAALIRAIIDGLFESEFEIKTVGSEQELRARVAQRLRP
jgi:hypothetical protein